LLAICRQVNGDLIAITGNRITGGDEHFVSEYNLDTSAQVADRGALLSSGVSQMSTGNPYQGNPYESPNPFANFVAFEQVDVRTAFLRRTYLHVLGAVLAFIGIELVLFSTGVGQNLTQTMLGGRWSWLIVLGIFMLVNMVAQKWAASPTSRSTQYAGLGLYVLAEAIIFCPILYIITQFFPQAPQIIGSSAVITLVMFGGLTAVFMTKADFSYLGRYLYLAGFAACGAALLAILFNYHLGVWFSFAMVVLMCGYILYQTSEVMNHLHTDQYVAAALMLFSSLATLFYYVLRIAMEFSRD
jgi:FtsH-binding integral membrane protein